MCASDSYRSQFHMRVPNMSVSERTRAMNCPHASRNLQVLNSRILVSTRKRTLDYSQPYSRALAIELSRTCNQTHEYSQLNSRVLAIFRVGNNLCGCVTQSYYLALVHVQDGNSRKAFLTRWRVVMIILQQVYVCLRRSLQTKSLKKKTKDQKPITCPPVKFFAMLVKTETFFQWGLIYFYQ